MKAWKIKGWGEYKGRHRLFECAQSSKYERPAWLPLPINLTGERFRVLMADRDGQAAFGVFVSLCELAALSPVKGALLTVEGAMSLRSMCAKTGIPIPDLEAAITFLSAEEIRWLEPLSDRKVADLLRRAKREQSGSKVGATYPPEQEQETAAEQDRDSDKDSKQQPQLSIADGGFAAAEPHAAAANPDGPEVSTVLRRLWPKGHKADELADLPGATMERVAWLIHRLGAERITRKQGFVEKGIREGWIVDPAWAAKFRRSLGGAA